MTSCSHHNGAEASGLQEAAASVDASAGAAPKDAIPWAAAVPKDPSAGAASSAAACPGQPSGQNPAAPSSKALRRRQARIERRTQAEVRRRAQDEAFMAVALEEAHKALALGEVPIGAVVVHHPVDRATGKPTAEPQIIARAHNLRETRKDPSAHAEFLAMQDACRVLDNWRLGQCTVYVTLEPCIMCAGLMHQSRVARCVFGAADPKAGATGTLYQIHQDERLNHRFEVTAGVCEEPCAALLQEFFQQRRQGTGPSPLSASASHMAKGS